MALHDVEREIWQSAKVIVNNPKLRLKDILEWSTGDIKPESDEEIVVRVPDPGVNICIFKKYDKRS